MIDRPRTLLNVNVSELVKRYKALSTEKMVEEQGHLRNHIFLPFTSCDPAYVIGLDISFSDNQHDSCVCGVILSYPQLQVLDHIVEPVTLFHSYKSGYLAFREVPHYINILQKLENKHPNVFAVHEALLVMVDGAGINHPRLIGSASHLGVITGLQTIGVAKKFLPVQRLNSSVVDVLLETELATFPSQAHMFLESLTQPILTSDPALCSENAPGPHDDIVPVPKNLAAVYAGSEPIVGVVRPSASKHVQYVSVGHQFSLRKAVEVVLHCCTNTRTPEPIRQADLLSRAWIREFRKLEV